MVETTLVFLGGGYLNSELDKINDLVLKFENGSESSFNDILNILHKDIYFICKQFYSSGIDREELYQYASIGVWEGIRGFKNGQGANIKTFIKICIKRKVIDLVKSNTRKKHRTLNNSLELKNEVLSDAKTDPEYLLILSENNNEITDIIYNLTEKQRDSFLLYMDGYKQKEISIMLNLTSKQVDNALTKAKAKLRELYRDRLRGEM